jgi:hypothetical protein
MLLRTSLLLSVAAMVLACGAKHEPIVDAQGKLSELVSCRQREDCVKLAQRLCPFGYTLDSSRGNALTMLVTCNAPLDESASSSASASCRGVYSGVEAFAAFWSTNRPTAARRATFPSESEYAVVCWKLPALLQKCMMTSYREEHAQPCDAAAQHLQPALAAKVDALFFELPREASSNDSP